MSNLYFGAQEAAELLGLTRQGLHERRKAADFPRPVAELRCGPVWQREQLVEYARSRVERYEERAAVERLAEDVLSIAEAARVLGCSAVQLRSVAEQWPGMPVVWNLKTGALLGIRRDGLGVFARAVGTTAIEAAVIG